MDREESMISNPGYVQPEPDLCDARRLLCSFSQRLPLSCPFFLCFAALHIRLQNGWSASSVEVQFSSVHYKSMGGCCCSALDLSRALHADVLFS